MLPVGCCYFQADFDISMEEKSCPPRLLVVMHQNELQSTFIVAYDKALQCTGSTLSMCSFLQDLIAAYFAWDVNYPTQYQLLLGLLQSRPNSWGT